MTGGGGLKGVEKWSNTKECASPRLSQKRFRAPQIIYPFFDISVRCFYFFPFISNEL